MSHRCHPGDWIKSVLHYEFTIDQVVGSDFAQNDSWNSKDRDPLQLYCL